MGMIDYKDWDKPKVISKCSYKSSFIDSIKTVFSPSFKKKSTFILRGVSEVRWNLRDDQRLTQKMFTIYFYENDFDQRKYDISGVGYDLTYWPRLPEFHHMELWLRSGIKPAWYADILQKKLMS